MAVGQIVKILDAVRTNLLAIKTTNLKDDGLRWHQTIPKVLISEGSKFQALKPDIEMPAILILADSTLEPETNKEYENVLTLDIIVRFKVPNTSTSPLAIFDTLATDIQTAVNQDITFGLTNSTICTSFWTSISIPIETIKSDIYQFVMILEVTFKHQRTKP